MKALFCANCGDIRSPEPRALLSTHCRCRTCAIWWVDPARGIIKVWCATPARKYAWIIGVHNWFLADPDYLTEKKTVEFILANTPDTYVFSRVGSPVVKFRPGYTSDSSWATAEEYQAATPLMDRIAAASGPVEVLQLGPQRDETEPAS